MRKSRMISIIAASMLTATVVFTGCGGGGGSSSLVASSSSSSSSSITPQITPKTVKVSDWWINGATVVCGGNTAVAKATIGHYEFDIENCPANMVSTGGYSDTNRDGAISNGDLKAPKMEAPANYNNINAFTTFIAKGVAPAQLANALGLPADTNFDVAVPEASDQIQRIAPVVTALLAALEAKTITRSIFPGDDSSEEVAKQSSCLPGQPCTSSSTGNEESSAATSSTPNILTMAMVVAGFNAGKTLNDFLPQELLALKSTLESAEAGSNYELLAAPTVKKYTGIYGESTTSSSVSSSVSSTVTSGGIFPGEDEAVDIPITTSSEASSEAVSSEASSEAVSSEASSEAASSSECDELPGSNNTCQASSSSEVSTSSVSSIGTGDFPSDTGKGEESSSLSQTSSSSTNSTSSAASESATGDFPSA